MMQKRKHWMEEHSYFTVRHCNCHCTLVSGGLFKPTGRDSSWCFSRKKFPKKTICKAASVCGVFIKKQKSSVNFYWTREDHGQGPYWLSCPRPVLSVYHCSKNECRNHWNLCEPQWTSDCLYASRLFTLSVLSKSFTIVMFVGSLFHLRRRLDVLTHNRTRRYYNILAIHMYT